MIKNYKVLVILLLIPIIILLIMKYYGNRKGYDLSKESKYKVLVSRLYNKGSKLFQDCSYSYEIPERLSVYFFLEPDDKVLEIGGNVGGVSEVIAKTLNNPKNLVVVEPSDIAIKTLNDISVKNGSFNVHHGCLVCGTTNLLCKFVHNNYFSCEKVEYKVDNNITYEELESKYSVIFNVLVIDCEGCYQDFLKYGFDNNVFGKIEKIFIEWDGKFEEDIILQNGFTLIGMFPHKDLIKGNRVYYR